MQRWKGEIVLPFCPDGFFDEMVPKFFQEINVMTVQDLKDKSEDNKWLGLQIDIVTIVSGSCGRAILQCVKATTNPCPSSGFFTFNTTRDTAYFCFCPIIF